MNYTKVTPFGENTVQPFEGIFLRSGNVLRKVGATPPLELFIAVRKVSSPNKPPYFALLDYPAGTGRVYFSSLYPTEVKDVFNLEYQGNRYKLNLGPDAAEIHLVSTPQKKAA